MYKIFLFFLSLSATIAYSSDDSKAPFRKSFYRLTDQGVDSTILSTQLKIEGHTYVGGNPMKGVLVSTDSRADEVRSDSEGRYSMTISPTSASPMIVSKAPKCKEQVINDKAFNLGHRYIIDWYFYNNEGTNDTRVKKPVIYLYSDEEKEVELSIRPIARLSFTYPKLVDDTWSFNINSDGLRFSNGKTYPYLFWEAENAALNFEIAKDQLEGFVVSGDDIIDFFEENLPDLGLNSQEMTDFITFWGPEMSQNEQNLIQFWVDDQYDEQICEMEVSPEPEASRRIYMIYSAVDQHVLEGIEIIQPKFNEFERRSYTLIEWGGSQIEFKPNL